VARGWCVPISLLGKRPLATVSTPVSTPVLTPVSRQVLTRTNTYFCCFNTVPYSNSAVSTLKPEPWRPSLSLSPSSSPDEPLDFFFEHQHGPIADALPGVATATWFQLCSVASKNPTSASSLWKYSWSSIQHSTTASTASCCAEPSCGRPSTVQHGAVPSGSSLGAVWCRWPTWSYDSHHAPWHGGPSLGGVAAFAAATSAARCQAAAAQAHESLA
jgi:hypothetical protein